MKKISHLLVTLPGEILTAIAGVFASPSQAFTPAQQAKLAEMEQDYAELVRQRSALNYSNRIRPGRSFIP